MSVSCTQCGFPLKKDKAWGNVGECKNKHRQLLQVAELPVKDNYPGRTTCASARDGECNWTKCPQLINYQNTCPLLVDHEED